MYKINAFFANTTATTLEAALDLYWDFAAEYGYAKLTKGDEVIAEWKGWE